MKTIISLHFTLEELCATSTGLPNKPDAQSTANLVHLCTNVLEPLREAMRQPVKIGSGYRSKAVNAAVGGVSNSQHMTGQAVDLCIDGDMAKGRKWFEWIRDHCDFDQLIWEHNAKGSYWVHVSHISPAYGKNRRQVISNLLKK